MTEKDLWNEYQRKLKWHRKKIKDQYKKEHGNGPRISGLDQSLLIYLRELNMHMDELLEKGTNRGEYQWPAFPPGNKIIVREPYVEDVRTTSSKIFKVEEILSRRLIPAVAKDIRGIYKLIGRERVIRKMYS